MLGLFLLFACAGEPTEADVDAKSDDADSQKNTVIVADDTLEIKSDYKMDNVDAKERKEFRENLAQIELKHGTQWDFCTCVLANDSLNKAFQNPAISDADFEKASNRFDIVAEKCQAFQVQNPNQTPDERARHEKKVRDCLKAAK